VPDAPDPIVSPAGRDWQPYDTSDGSGPMGGWVKTADDVPGGSQDLFSTDYEDGPGPWRQT